jgi:hypothetical protein
VTHTPGPTNNFALPREISEFLTELANAYQKHTMYPDGHPLLATAADGLIRKLATLFEERSAIALGVSPDRLIIAGIATDPAMGMLREFAARLHRRNIGAIKFYKGVEPAEIVSVLRAMSRESGPLDEALLTLRWAHVRLQPLTYGQLELVGPGEQGPSGAGSWASRLWLDLSRAAMEQEGEPSPSAPQPTEVAQAIDARKSDPDYAQKIIGFFTDLTDACRARGGADALALQGHMSRLITAMAPETLQCLMELETSEEQRRKFMTDISQALAVDAVMDLVQAAAAATSRSLSPALVQLLTKLATHAESAGNEVRIHAESAFREQVTELIEGWEDYERHDPAPEDYRRTLERLPTPARATAPPRRAQTCEPSRVVMTSLEIDSLTEATERATDAMVHNGEIGPLLVLLEKAPHPAAAAALSQRVITVDALTRALAARPVDWTAVRQLALGVGADGIPLLFDALSDTDDQGTRARLVELLGGLDGAAGDLALKRLHDAPWAVQRSLLTLIAQLPVLPEGFSATEFIRHDDSRVRHDAVKILLGGATTRTRAICEVLVTEDPMLLRLAIGAAAENCPAAAVPLIIRLLKEGDLEAATRPVAIRAIAPVAIPMTLECLERQTLTRGRWFRRSRLASPSPVMLAALTGLATSWNANPRAAAIIALARASTNPEIRAAVAAAGAPAGSPP